MTPNEINNDKRLANYLRIELDQLSILYNNEYIIKDYCERIDNQNDVDSILNVDKFCIPKRIKKLGHRKVFKPKNETLVNCLKIFSNNLNKIYEAPNSVNGFVKGRGIKSNAKAHLKKEYILSIDISSFFETISAEMLIETLQEYGFTNEISIKISKIVTINDVLVQGFHTSPTLANMVFKKLDLIFEGFDKNLTYSRYADDLTFSSNSEIITVLEIKKLIKNFGFTVNEKKTKIMKRGQNQYVTGLTIFDNEYPRIAKRIKKKLRLEVYYINKFGLRNHTLKKLNITNKEYLENDSVKIKVKNEESYLFSKISGWLFYIKGIEPEFSDKYIKLLVTKKEDDK